MYVKQKAATKIIMEAMEVLADESKLKFLP